MKYLMFVGVDPDGQDTTDNVDRRVTEHDWIVGFDILECDDLDDAIKVASKHQMALNGRLELRPFWPFEG